MQGYGNVIPNMPMAPEQFQQLQPGDTNIYSRESKQLD